MIGEKHKYIGYHQQSEPLWVTKFGYRKSIMRYTCKSCGKSIKSDSGSGYLIIMLSSKTCKGENQCHNEEKEKIENSDQE